jgi:hypothetical protein
LKAPCRAGFRSFNGLLNILSCNAAPDLGPGAPFYLAEVVHFHGPQATLAHEAEVTLQVEDFDAVIGTREQAACELLVLGGRPDGKLQFKLTYDGLRQRGQCLSLLLGKALRARDVIENAEHSERQAVLCCKRNSRVKG